MGNNRQYQTAEQIEITAEDMNLFYEMVNCLPHPVTIYRPDGNLMFVNKAWSAMFHVHNSTSLIGKYNVLADPDMKRWGHIDTILKAFQGTASELRDIRVPLQDMVDKYGDHQPCSELLFQAISCFPVYLKQENIPYVAVLYINTQRYLGREAVLKAKDYMQKHWMEDFDINRIAAAAYLSRYHFTRVFKSDTGSTPYEYYQDLKIKMIMEKLRDKNLSVSDAFTTCGMVYTGSSATRFRKKVGMTPSQYRKYIAEE